jgi:transposase
VSSDYNGDMNRPDSIPQHVWDGFSDEARAVVSALVEGFERRIAELEARLNLDSTNSSKPPSTDPIGVKRKPPGRRRRSVGAGRKGIPAG